MIEASKADHADVVEILIDAGADVEIKNKYGETALIRATSKGHLAVVKVLVEEGKADLNAKDNTGLSSLIIAAFKGYQIIVEYLITKGADVDIESDAGESPIHGAVQGGKLETVKYLIEQAGANVDARQYDLATPIFRAAFLGHLEIVKYLHRKGADFNATSADGKNPLWHAAKQGHADVVEYLVRNGADVENQDYVMGTNPLQAAASSGQLDVVKILLQIGNAQLDVLDHDGSNALYYASYNQQYETMRYLHSLGAKVNVIWITDKRYESPLWSAVDLNHSKIADFLIRNGADVEFVNLKFLNETPLHVAARKGYLDMIKLLVEIGNANANSQRTDGLTVLEVAKQYSRNDVVLYLTNL